MPQIGVFDVVGPIMVGPSSSHTAGAVRLGLAARKILGEAVKSAEIGLHGSFAATYWGHRTDVAILAGLLGMAMDDPRIPAAEELADKAGLTYGFQTVDLGDVHPNSVQMRVKGERSSAEVIGASTGGGRILITSIDQFPVAIEGTYTVLLAKYQDQPGVVAEVTRILADFGINIAFMNVSRKMRGSTALLVAETDDPIAREVLEQVQSLQKGITARVLPSF
jgi:L-serine dehydratase